MRRCFNNFRPLSRSFNLTLPNRQLSTEIYRPRRALLYMPGSNMKMLNKVPSLQVDTICMDLEDGVAANKKSESRHNIVSALNSVDFGEKEKLVRINPYGSGLEKDDIKTVLEAKTLPDGIVLPKVDNPSHVQWLSDSITSICGERGDDMKIIILIESIQGVLNLSEIIKSDERLEALIFGADDFAADIGATRTIEGKEVFFARNLVLIHAKSQNLQAIDMVQINYQNVELLEKESMEGFQMGYTGKQIIHPNQIAIVQKCFSPDKNSLIWAKRVVEENAKHQNDGLGAFTLDGKMIDMPTVKQAERLLNRGRACRLIE